MLRLFYVCYYVAVGISVPYFPPYLKNLGFSGRDVSLVMAVAPLLHLGVPIAWGWAADRTRRPDLLLRVACAGAALFMAPLVFVRTMPALLFVFAAYQLFSVSIGGLTDTIALERVRREGGDYARLRLWGSLSFVVTCWTAGPVLATRGRPDGDPLVPTLIATGLGLAFLAAFTLRAHTGREQPHLRDLRALIDDRRFRFLLVIAPLHWGATAAYHGFFAILIQDRGLPPTTIGSAFAVSVLGEVAAFYFFRHLHRRFSLPTLLMAVFAGSAVRWALIAVVADPVPLVALQLLHGLTFGVFWGAAIAWLVECVPPKLRATGQTLYSAATLGAGNILGTLACGYLYDATGGATASFAAAGAVELVPLVLTVALGRRVLTPAPALASSPPGSSG